jgi:hypothetical protein
MTSLATQIMLPSQFVEFLNPTKMLLELLYHKHKIKFQILRNLVTQVWLLIFCSNTKCPAINYSYFYDFLDAVLWSLIFERSKFH